MKCALMILFTFASQAAAACPFCNSKTAAQIRVSLFGPDFFFNLLACVLPFAVFLVIALLIYTGGWQKRSVSKST